MTSDACGCGESAATVCELSQLKDKGFGFNQAAGRVQKHVLPRVWGRERARAQSGEGSGRLVSACTQSEGALRHLHQGRNPRNITR